MDVTDAYLIQVIEAEEVVLDVDETEDLKTWVSELARERTAQMIDQIIENAEANQHVLSEDEIKLSAEDVAEVWIELCVHSFMAGRAYQTQFEPEVNTDITVSLTPELLSLFLSFLAKQVEV